MAEVPDAIFNTTQDARTQAAMLLGSSLEGGWNSPYPVGDSGTSFGPYQLHKGGLLTSLGLTQAQAENAQEATTAMLPIYTAAVNKISNSLWNSNPEQAAEQAAVIAEKPAAPYFTSQGQSKVDTAWNNSLNAINNSGAQTTSFPGSGILSGLAAQISGGLTGGIMNALSGILGIQGLGSAIKSDAERIGLVIFGALIVLVGIIVLAYPTAKSGAKTAAEARFAAKGIGIGGGADQADRDRRSAIAERSLSIGEKNAQTKATREARLARRP